MTGFDWQRELPGLRAEFPILANTTYLINNSLGAMPRGVDDGLATYARAWRARGVRAWHEGWWELPLEIGDLLTPFLGVTPGHVAMHPNVTIATAVFLSCLDYPESRNRIVYTDMNFPSLRYLLAGEERKGAVVRVVPSADGIGIETETLLAAIDHHTRLVPISHVLFKSAFIQDARRIAERCREVGALLLLDVFQSAGIMPLELEAWGVDAAVGGCLKWLCGGPGNCFLWVRPDLGPELVPAFTGWQSHKDPFGFHGEHDRIESGAWRFLTGTPNIPALHAARPGLEILGRIPPRDIRSRSLALTQHLIETAEHLGLEVRSPRESSVRGGTVTVWLEGAETICQRLLAEDIVCDFRPGAGIRFSPHVFNSEEECDRALSRTLALAT